MPRCVDCATAEDVAIYNLCRPCHTAQVQRGRAAQGLPPKITDGPTLDVVAALIDQSFRNTVPARKAVA